MTGVQRVFALAGVREDTWRWVGEDFAAAFTELSEPHELAQLLMGLGAPLSAVEAPVRAVLEVFPCPAAALELSRGTRAGVYNAYIELSYAGVDSGALCNALRAVVPLATVARLALGRLSDEQA